MSEQVE
jgi:hypothetical protein